MLSYTANCLCRDVTLTLELPTTLESHSARVCDCDFCTQRNLCYLSDVEGRLYVQFKTPYTTQQQGSNQASFLTCAHCSSVVAVVLETEGTYRGAVNVTLFSECSAMQAAIIVSPKQLSAEEKRQRWANVWMPVTLRVGIDNRT
mgnify:CR=1 FL=1